ncbi:DUF748 domain-containing protein [Candidatus Omnitrophota bacterium]
MRILKIILTSLLAILIILLSTAYIFVSLKGRVLLTQQLEKALNKRVNIGYLGLKMPLGAEIRDLRIEGLTDIDYIYVSPHLFGLLSGKIILDRLIISGPKFDWVIESPENKTAKINSQVRDKREILVKAKAAPVSPAAETHTLPPVIIKYLRIKDGVINLIDRTVPQPGLTISLKDILLDVDNLCLASQSAISNFQLMTKIPWQEGSAEGSIYASGWLNLYKRDMQARIEIENIDGVYLHPYYSQWVDLEGARIDKASLNFTSDIQGRDNEVVAQCRLELADIQFKPRPPEQPEQKAEKITTVILGMFRSLNQGKVVLNFTVRTKMDKPEFGVSDINQAVEDTLNRAMKSDKVSIEDVAALPAKLVGGVARGTTGATKAIVGGAFSVGKSLLDVFTLEQPEDEESQPAQEDLLKN